MFQIDVRFHMGASVRIDKDNSLRGYITGFIWRGLSVEYEVSWMINGTAQSAWFADWRLSEKLEK